MPDRDPPRRFPDARADVDVWDDMPDTAQTRAPAYRLAFADPDFLVHEALRPVRLQLELLKPEMLMAERDIRSTIVMFGGARIPRPDQADRARTATLAGLAHFYDEARRFAQEMTRRAVAAGGQDGVIVTGGGPGVMEAGNLGAEQAGGVSIGLNIVLPHEQAPNEHVTPDLCFNFHYFAIRKMHFLMRAKAITVFPGGFGTLDETFEALTLIQTGRMARLPFILFGRDWWQRVINWDALADSGTIGAEDLQLFRMVDTAEDAIAIIDAFEAG